MEEAGVLLAGPNGQGIVSTPSSLCAQIVAPYPPAGRIGVASQSGNIVSTFENLALSTGIGISRAVSAGNAAVVEVADYLEFFADRPRDRPGLAYLEGVRDGRALFDAPRRAAERATARAGARRIHVGGQHAAASHTGALATDDRIFSGMCRQAGSTSLPPWRRPSKRRRRSPRSRSRAARTSRCSQLREAGACSPPTRSRALRAVPAVVARRPPRRHRQPAPAAVEPGQPDDLAAAETRDTIPQILELLAADDARRRVLFLGSGVQSNQAKLMRTGAFVPGHDLERIIEFHERQDVCYAEVAADVSAASGKPILVATELAVTDPDNPGPRTVRETGRSATGRPIAGHRGRAPRRWARFL